MLGVLPQEKKSYKAERKFWNNTDLSWTHHQNALQGKRRWEKLNGKKREKRGEIN